jgi:putative chitinase
MQLTKQDFIDWGVKINIDVYLPYFNEYIFQFRVDTKDRLINFFSNLLHESGNLYYKEEITDGKYLENRIDLGNTQKGDGLKYSGKSYAQITGRANYKAFTKWCKLNIDDFDIDFEVTPKALLLPKYCVLSAFWFWKVNNLEKYSFVNVCSIWNTGRTQNPLRPHKINGIEDRKLKYAIIEKWCIKNKIT